MKRHTWLIVIFVIVASITSCGKRQDIGKVKESGPILAKVGDETITLNEFNDRISKLPDNIKSIAEDNKAQYLDNLVLETLLYKEALKKKIDKDKEIEDLFQEAKKRIIIARLAKEEIEDRIKIDEKKVENYYQEHKDEFISPELFRASHILVNTLEEAVKIVDKLNAGAVFEELAKKDSLDVTNKRGGDVGFFSQGQMVPEFEDACLRLKVGEVSSPVKTQFGYHIIKLTDKKAPEPIEYEKVKERIENFLAAEERRVLFNDLITRLRSETPISINRELIEPKEEPEEEPAGGKVP